jgi:hypothetical protein
MVHIACDEPDLLARRNTRSVFLVGTRAAASAGHRSALILPRVRDENAGPIFFFFDKSRSNRIEENVISLFAEAFFFSQPMFEKIALPINLQRFCGPFFPFTNNCLNTLLGLRK